MRLPSDFELPWEYVHYFFFFNEMHAYNRTVYPYVDIGTQFSYLIPSLKHFPFQFSSVQLLSHI